MFRALASIFVGSAVIVSNVFIAIVVSIVPFDNPAKREFSRSSNNFVFF